MPLCKRSGGNKSVWVKVTPASYVIVIPNWIMWSISQPLWCFPRGSTFSLFKSSTSSNSSYRWLGFLHNTAWDNACFNLRQSGVCSDRNKKIEVCCVGLSQQLFFIYTTLLCVRPKIASVQTPLSHWLFSPTAAAFLHVHTTEYTAEIDRM